MRYLVILISLVIIACGHVQFRFVWYTECSRWPSQVNIEGTGWLCTAPEKFQDDNNPRCHVLWNTTCCTLVAGKTWECKPLPDGTIVDDPNKYLPGKDVGL